MGVDYTSYAVIGCEIPPSALEVTKIVKGCSCPEHNISYKFCPDCGKKTKTKECGKQIWYKYQNGKYVIEGINGKTLDVVFSTDNERCFVGWSVETGNLNNGQPNKTAVPDNMFNYVKEILVPLGLWDESKYGLWVVQSCSY